ncbi:MAG TPA: GAF domain-containing protein [Dehalococcoidia bacterium]|nr:GAF domain-containing protein [Dehalococcoidia bacterium]
MGGTRARVRAKASVTSAELNLQEMLNGLDDELFIVDREYKVRFANTTILRAKSESGTAVEGGFCYQRFEGRERPCSTPMWNCPLNRVLQTGKPAIIIHPLHLTAGDGSRLKYIRIIIYPVRDLKGDIQAYAEFRRDVSTERQMEHEILKRHHHLNALSRISTAISGLLDLHAILNVCLDIVLEAVNGEKGGIMLLDDDDGLLRYRVYRGLSPHFVGEIALTRGQGIAGKVMESGEPVLLEDISKDSRVFHEDLVSMEGLKGFICVPLKTKDKVVGVINVASRMPGRFSQDDLYLLHSIGCQMGTAIEQARLYKNLAKAAERYQVLLRHALTAQEDERKRIARELHDETSQTLTSLTLTLQAIIQLVEMKGEYDADLLARLKSAHTHTVYAASEVVKLMKELRPTLLDELGLQAAVHRYARDNLQAHGIKVNTEFEGTDSRLPPVVEVTLFRVAQGLMGNIMEHSAAKNTNVKLKCDEHRCVMRIEDDGKGFDVDRLTRVEPGGRGAGLFTIKERIKLAGGQCKIDSKPGHGTKITVSVPLIADVTSEKDKSLDS